MATSEEASDVTEFYLACRNGDVKFVKDYLAKLSYIKWNPNHFEPSVKSTPLHAACLYGHKEIVQLLLEHGCDRSQVNGYGLTAYEEATNDEIRELFKRPTNGAGERRFQEENTKDCFDLVDRPKEKTEKGDAPVEKSHPKTKKTPTVQGYGTEAEKNREVGYATTSIAMCQSRFGRFLADTFQRGAPMSLKTITDRLQDIIDKEITANKDPQAHKANELLNKYTSDPERVCIEYLIRLYTLETKFYRSLKQTPIPLALPLYMALHTLKDRYYQGQCYRGAKMDDDDIATYEWAANNHGSLLQTRHFSSTSFKRSVAEEFINTDNKRVYNTERKPVLLVFNFPKKCEQAINLSRISDEQPCLSDFENEAEVLILPWTLFQVDSVEKEPSSSSSSYTICLTNVVLPRKNMWSSLKWILKHPKGSIDRFHEHFPEKQPEFVVKQLMDSLPVTKENISKEKDEERIVSNSSHQRCPQITFF